MALDKKAVINKLLKSNEYFVLFSGFTKLPYVTCDEESYNDQAMIFASEEELKAYGQELLKDKILTMGMKYPQNAFPRLFNQLLTMGVNSVLWIDGEERKEVELSDFVKMNDFSKMEPAKRPLINQSLALSASYFMQELRRPVEKDQHKNLRDLEDELMVNLVKADYLVVTDPVEGDPKKINIPLLKDKKGNALQPLFTDALELSKFTKGKNYRILKVNFSRLAALLHPQAGAYCINPITVNIVLNKAQLEKISDLYSVYLEGDSNQASDNMEEKKEAVNVEGLSLESSDEELGIDPSYTS